MHGRFGWVTGVRASMYNIPRDRLVLTVMIFICQESTPVVLTKQY